MSPENMQLIVNNHEKVESSKFFGLFSSSKVKTQKTGANSLGKSIQVNQNMGDFRRIDPSIEAGNNLMINIIFLNKT